VHVRTHHHDCPSLLGRIKASVERIKPEWRKRVHHRRLRTYAEIDVRRLKHLSSEPSESKGILVCQVATADDTNRGAAVRRLHCTKAARRLLVRLAPG
jgi:hypothetical protein